MPVQKVKVIVPITGTNEDAILKETSVIAKTDADVVEWRFDLAKEICRFDEKTPIGDATVYSAAETLQGILKLLKDRLPGEELLFTIRTQKQGGEFINDQEVYERLVCEAVKSRCLSFVDVEDSTEKCRMNEIFSIAGQYGVKTIVSFHDFDKTPEFDRIIEKFNEIMLTGGDIIKTAYMPKNPQDVAALMSATAYYKEKYASGHEMITMAMGDLGKISRVSGEIFGSDYTFASVGECSAPGQMPISTVRSIMSALGKQ